MTDKDIEMVPIKDFPGYFITEGGDIYSSRGRYGSRRLTKLAFRVTAKGYSEICLYTEENKKVYKRVHRLVLETFVGDCPSGMEVRHLDGKPSNNCLSNLKWGTKAENENDRKAHGKVPKGSHNPASKLKEADVLAILAMDGSPATQLASLYGVCRDTIFNIRNGRKWGWLTGRKFPHRVS